MKSNNNQKILVEIIIKYDCSFQYYLPDSYLKFNEDLFKRGYPLSNGELSYINANNQKIIIKSKNDFISLLRYARSVPYKIKIFYEKELIDSFINDFKFIDIKNVYSDLNIEQESNIDLPQMNQNEGDETFNTLNTLNELENNIDKGSFSQGIKLITNLLKKLYFHKFLFNINSDIYIIKYNNKIDFNKIPSNKIADSIKLEYNIPSIEELFNNFKIDVFQNNDDDILNKLNSQFEKIEDNNNNNFLYQTMVNASKASKIKKGGGDTTLNNKNNNNDNNNIYKTEIINSPIMNHLGVECKNCHMKPITNKRYKCPKCINYNLCEKCEEKNYYNSFHPHKDFIMIRINEKNFSDSPYSYQCLNKNLIFNIKKDEIINNEIIIKNILLKNNFILPWPGFKNTIIKCDKSLSTIFCEKIILPNLALGNTVNVNFIFKKIKNIPKNEYKCITNFMVYNEKYGEPLEIIINLI